MSYVLLVPNKVTIVCMLCQLSIATESAGGGPPSYICRLSGSSPENWTFWLEVHIDLLSSMAMATMKSVY